MRRIDYEVVKYRVESATFKAIAAALEANGVHADKVRPLLVRSHNLVIKDSDDADNLTIYYIVTQPMCDAIAQEIATSKIKEDDQPAYIFSAKVGMAPAMGLTEKTVRETFHGKIAEHNAKP